MLKIVPFLFLIILLASLAYVVRCGRWPERSGLAIIMLGSIATALVGRSDLWRGTEIGILAVDVVVLMAFLAIVALTDRFWPLWVSAFQLVSVTSHLARLLTPSTLPLAYAFAEQVWSYAMIAVVIGSVAWQRRYARSSFSSKGPSA
ncbi:hypothetical protein [Sphingomonas sp. Leaf4]|uniref:hypothetical protein n=1 Tax=Sphingomonas sp. Leaf4 TaxID=2876553 RepID=UPI001E53AFB0|nr:hypothetical protein [Sphingomonas sp. Leaf4]